MPCPGLDAPGLPAVASFVHRKAGGPRVVGQSRQLGIVVHGTGHERHRPGDSRIRERAEPIGAAATGRSGPPWQMRRDSQRVRIAVPAIGEAKSGVEIVSMLALRMGYDLEYPHASHVMTEISRLVPDYAGVTYARLERGGVNVPVESYMDPGSPILTAGPDGLATLSPSLIATAAD